MLFCGVYKLTVKVRDSLSDTTREATTIAPQDVPSRTHYIWQIKDILWAFLFGSRTAPIWTCCHHALGFHNPTARSIAISRCPGNFFPEWPLNFCVTTIHQVFWQSPGTLLTVRLSSSQMRKTVSLSLNSLKKVSFLRVLFFSQSVALVCMLVRVEGFCTRWDPSTKEILPFLRALTYEAERFLDLPRHGIARALPVFVNGVSCWSAQRERGGDRYSQRRKMKDEHLPPPDCLRDNRVRRSFSRRRFWERNVGACPLGSLREPRDRNDSPILGHKTKQHTHVSTVGQFFFWELLCQTQPLPPVSLILQTPLPSPTFTIRCQWHRLWQGYHGATTVFSLCQGFCGHTFCQAPPFPLAMILIDPCTKPHLYLLIIKQSFAILKKIMK